MKIQAPFGFVTGCHAGDKFMVQATLASMRHYCPTVPICLVVDGHFDVTALQKQYDLCILRITDLPSAAMRTLIGSNQRAKLAAIWEGPFNFFVWLDSDATMVYFRILEKWGYLTTSCMRNPSEVKSKWTLRIFSTFGHIMGSGNWKRIA